MHVGIWLRVSTEDQVKGESPLHHQRRAEAYAEAKGWKVVEVYDFGNWSGKSTIDHPEAKRMLDDIERGHIQGLIFSKLARLARSTKELIDYAERFEEAGASMVSLGESIDTSTAAGRMFYRNIASLAQWEREEVSERVIASLPERAKLGKPLGGVAPFGFQWRDKKLVPHPDEAPVRAKIYEVYLKEKRLKTTARVLNDAGYRTRKGGKFTITTIRRLIEDTTAKGVRIANKARNAGNGGAWELKDKSEWVTVSIPRIVSDELWQEANDLLDSQTKRRGGKTPTKKVRHLFVGHVSCHCGVMMKVPYQSKKYVCPKCKNKIPIDDLEEIYQGELGNFIIATDDIERQLNKAATHQSKKRTLLEVNQKELASIERRINTLLDLVSEGNISKDQFQERNDPLYERKREIETELATLEAELTLLEVDLLSANLVTERGVELSEKWADLDFDERRSVIETITQSIVVGRGEISIQLYLLPFLTISDRPDLEPGSRKNRKTVQKNTDPGGQAAHPPTTPYSRDEAAMIPQEGSALAIPLLKDAAFGSRIPAEAATGKRKPP